MINPFGLFLYLYPIMKELPHKSFVSLLFKASVISFLIYLVFLVLGNVVFDYIFQIRFDSFRIFGGIIIFSFAFLFIVKGHRAYITLKEDLTDMATEVAIPFIVGAGTISLTILMSRNGLPLYLNALQLIVVLTIVFLIIMVLKAMRESFEKRQMRLAFDKNIEILLRINAFFLGAIGVNLVVEGVLNLLA